MSPSPGRTCPPWIRPTGRPSTRISKSSGSPLPTDFLHELGAAVLLNGRFGGGLSNVDLTGITNVHESTRHPGNGTPGVAPSRGLDGAAARRAIDPAGAAAGAA